MPNYNEAQGVADLLSKFDFNIISEGPCDFSTQHRKYTCEFSKPGIESFTTTYQSNPRFGEGISLYVNEEGLFTCPPNRAVYATKGMEEAGYLSMMVSMMDYGSPVKEGELYSILCGDLVAVGFDFETGENRDLSADEMSRVADYFTEVSKPGSGIEEVIAIRMGQHREEARSEDGRVTLKGEAQASRAASEKLAEGRDIGSPARDDHSIV